jgi:hypothetical protein
MKHRIEMDGLIPSFVVPDDREAKSVRHVDQCVPWNVIPLALYLHAIFVAGHVVFDFFRLPTVGSGTAAFAQFILKRVRPGLYFRRCRAKLSVVRRLGNLGKR